jgi:hypothetical protein
MIMEEGSKTRRERPALAAVNYGKILKRSTTGGTTRFFAAPPGIRPQISGRRPRTRWKTSLVFTTQRSGRPVPAPERAARAI